jgi:hypothetical protein
MKAAFIFLFISSALATNTRAQETIYHGKIIRGDDGCPTLIKIKSSDNGPISHHIILPTGHLPEDWHYGQKITFTMAPLRQPIPSDCKAQVVASIALITEEPRLLPFK